MWINIPRAPPTPTSRAGRDLQERRHGDGVTYPGLNPNLKIYLEYSNEVWGGIPNEYYQEAAVQNSADNQPLSTFPATPHLQQPRRDDDDRRVHRGRPPLPRTDRRDRPDLPERPGRRPDPPASPPGARLAGEQQRFYPGGPRLVRALLHPASAAFYGMGNANYWSPPTTRRSTPDHSLQQQRRLTPSRTRSRSRRSRPTTG